MAETTYETQFTKENILALKNAVNKAVNEYAEKEIEGGKIDIFVILASLNQAAYEVVLRAFPKDDDDAKMAHDQMKVIADKMIKTIDEIRPDLESKAMSELLATTHVSSIIAEFYARRRDDYLKNLEGQAVAQEEVAVATDETATTEE